MKPTSARSTRRDFLQTSAALLASGGAPFTGAFPDANPSQPQSAESFATHQAKRRKELWGLLGDLPWQHRPGPPKLLSTEEHEDFTLQRLTLDLNGLEPVPALLLIPRKRQPRAPGLLYIHWHGGMYDLGKEQLLRGVPAQPE